MATLLDPRLTLREAVVGVCVLFTALTVISSALALAGGGTHDSHAHLLLRLGFTTIGVGAVYLYGRLRVALPRVPVIVAVLGCYLAALAGVLGSIRLLGTAEDLHPDAYRDAFWNFTVVAVVVAAAWLTVGWIAGRRGRAAG